MHHGPRFTPSLVIAAALVVAIAAGCGSSSNSTTSTAALSKAAFLAKANAICKAGNAKQTAAQKTLGKQPTKAQIQSYATSTAIPNIQSQIDQVRALGAPAGDQAKVSAMLATAQADLNKIKSNPDLIAGDQFGNFAKVAHPYGLTSCAAGS